MSKKILFPFLSDKNFHRGYSWSMELAERMDATVCFFTSVPADETKDSGLLKNIYHSLLEARGNYLQNSYHAHPGKAVAKSERFIETGEFNGALVNLVKTTKFDVIVVDPQASPLSTVALHDVVENSNGVIVLPEEGTSFSQPVSVTGDDFYKILQRSELHKLPGNFFRTLGKDTTLFNYLRGFFRKTDKPAPATGL